MSSCSGKINSCRSWSAIFPTRAVTVIKYRLRQEQFNHRQADMDSERSEHVPPFSVLQKQQISLQPGTDGPSCPRHC